MRAKVYISGGRRNAEFIGALIAALRAKGHYAADWPCAVRLHAAGGAPPDYVGESGVHDIRALEHSDLYVCFLEEAGRSTYIELGLAAPIMPAIIVFQGAESDQPALVQGLLRLGWIERWEIPHREVERWAVLIEERLLDVMEAEKP